MTAFQTLERLVPPMNQAVIFKKHESEGFHLGVREERQWRVLCKFSGCDFDMHAGDFPAYIPLSVEDEWMPLASATSFSFKILYAYDGWGDSEQPEGVFFSLRPLLEKIEEKRREE